MKTLSIATAFWPIAAAVAFVLASGHDPLAIGDAAPMADQPVMTTAESTTTINAERGDNGIVVVFTCNTCPWVEKWEDRYEPLVAAARDAGMGVLMLNSNEAIRDKGESLSDMQARAADKGYTFTYAVDQDSEIADAFGARRTPEVFIFNADLRLIYHGAIDDNARDATKVEQAFAFDAIAAYSAGQPVPMEEANSIGCTIKRKRK